MEPYEYSTPTPDLNHRSIFANAVLKLIYQKHDGDLDAAVEEAKPFFEHFENNIRNIYELIDDEIPLYSYYNLLEADEPDDLDLTEDEYKQSIINAKAACELYYK